MKESKFNKAFPNYKQQDKWFNWGSLIFWTIIFQWIGSSVYLIKRGNLIAQRIKD